MQAYLRRDVPEDNVTKLFPAGGHNTVLFSPRRFYDALGLDYHSQDLFSRYYEPIKLSCGKCIACRAKHSKQMAARAWFEAQQYKVFEKEYDFFGSSIPSYKLNCSFLTLTLSDEYMAYRSRVLGYEPFKLCHSEFQLFMKRLRKAVSVPIRYYMCGEYGSKTHRPHYHAIIYGYDFPDKHCSVVTPKGNYYNSELLSKLWWTFENGKPFMSMGHTTIGDVTEATCSYVAQYILKKLQHSIDDGSYIRCSTNPGIGFLWLQDNERFYLEQSYVTFGGQKIGMPRYYDNKLKELYPEYYENIILPARRQFAYNNMYSEQSCKEAVQYRHKNYFERKDL